MACFYPGFALECDLSPQFPAGLQVEAGHFPGIGLFEVAEVFRRTVTRPGRLQGEEAGVLTPFGAKHCRLPFEVVLDLGLAGVGWPGVACP